MTTAVKIEGPWVFVTLSTDVGGTVIYRVRRAPLFPDDVVVSPRES